MFTNVRVQCAQCPRMVDVRVYHAESEADDVVEITDTRVMVDRCGHNSLWASRRVEDRACNLFFKKLRKPVN